MLDRYLHVMEWKVDGKWNMEEVLLDYSVIITALFVITSALLYIAL